MTPHVFIIAEAGVNHGGDMGLAKRLIDIAAEAGADAVKFQSFRAAELLGRAAPKAEYQKRTSDAAESSFDMIQRLELSEADHEELIAHANVRGIGFLSTPFDVSSLRLLTVRFGIRTIKIPSGEITNAPFLVAIARAAKRVILSTGMSTLAEVEQALGALAFGFTSAPDVNPRAEDFARAFESEAGQRALRERVAILHCTTEYPAPLAEVNLRAMDTLAASFGLPVGYSDHTQGINVALAAVARGACMIEKHFTTDRTLPGPDQAASIEPDELRALVRQVRDIEQALGDGIKRPSPSETKNIAVARKSLVAARPIVAGEVLSPDNVTCKRPGTGASPFDYWRTIGRIAGRDYARDEVLDA